MALVVKDRVKQTTTTTGTGNIVLNGNVDGFQTFAAALTDGDTTYFGIFVPSTNDYEVGLGTWTEGSATLARTTILESSNSGSAINITAQAEVFITQPAEKAVFQDANGDVDLGSNKILFGNVYSGTNDLPSASTYHGMFAHVHGTGKAYYAHGGNWIELVNEDTSGNVSMGGNLTVTGDLTVNGTTTTVNTTNTVVTDSLIELGNGTSGSPSNDAGIVIERGSSDNAFIGYDESADKFTVGTGSFTGATTGNLTISTGTLVANVEGNVTGNVTGNVSGSSGSTTGNAATATTAGTVTTAAQPNITSLGTLTTLTVDDITINGSTISDAANLTIDVGGDLIIDVDGADVKFKDGGTEFAHLFKSGNNFGIYSAISDGDIQFIGVDGGAQVTALTLDMSDAGSAIFNHDVKVNDNGNFFAGTSGDLAIYHDGSNSYIVEQGTGNLNITSNSDLTLDVSGDIILDTDSGEVWLKDGGTNFGRFFQSSGNLYINQPTQDQDIIIQGNDGGANVNALTFDMSDAGTATFNHDIKLGPSGGDVFIYYNSAKWLSTPSNAKYLSIGDSGSNPWDGNTGTRLMFGSADSNAIDGYYIGTNLENYGGNYNKLDIDYGTGIRLKANKAYGGTRFYDAHDDALLMSVGTGNTDVAVTNNLSVGGGISSVDNIYLADKIYHEGDTNTYVGFNSADQITFHTGGWSTLSVNPYYLTCQGSIYNYYAYYDESSQLTGTTPTINAANGGVYYLTMSGNTTFTFTNTQSGWAVGFVLYLTGNGSTVTWPNSVNWAGGTAPDAPANGETDILVFHTRDGSNWYGVLSIDAAS